MEKYNFFYGTQIVEFERPIVPDVVVEKGIKSNIKVKTYSVGIKSWRTKVVVKNVFD